MNKLIHIVHNREDYELKVVIEPWAEEITLAPGKKLKMEISYFEADLLEIKIGRKPYISVWLWGGCTATLSMDGEDCTPPTLQIPSV